MLVKGQRSMFFSVSPNINILLLSLGFSYTWRHVMSLRDFRDVENDGFPRLCFRHWWMCVQPLRSRWNLHWYGKRLWVHLSSTVGGQDLSDRYTSLDTIIVFVTCETSQNLWHWNINVARLLMFCRADVCACRCVVIQKTCLLASRICLSFNFNHLCVSARVWRGDARIVCSLSQVTWVKLKISSRLATARLGSKYSQPGGYVWLQTGRDWRVCTLRWGGALTPFVQETL